MLQDPLAVRICMIVSAAAFVFNMLVEFTYRSLENFSRSKWDELPEKKQPLMRKYLDQPFRYRGTDKLLQVLCVASGSVCLWMAALPDWKNALIRLAVYLAAMITVLFFAGRTADQHAEGMAAVMCSFQRALCILFFPLTWLLRALSSVLLLIFRQNRREEDEQFSEEDVMSLLEEGQKNGAIQEEGRKMIGSIFQFDDELAYEIMTPRTDVFMIDIDDTPDEYLDQLMSMRYSRIPVYEEEPDNILGILHIKDFLIQARKKGFDHVDIRSILRKPYLVPETKNIAALFMELQATRQHICILIDEYGGFSGIVTMEDIIEEIVGDIDDEYDVETEDIKELPDNTWLVSGNVALDDLNEETGSDLESENSETLGGFIIDLIGEIPKDGRNSRKVEYKNYTFTILYVKERRIVQVRMVIHPPEEDTEDEEN